MNNNASDIWSRDAEEIKAFIRARLDKVEADNAEAAELTRRYCPRSLDVIEHHDRTVWLMRKLKTEILGDPPWNCN